ncbi:hypothetical protein FKP32DRAFT_1648794 [Trametes sanguinea]|nr:hypothetical protein FKP32DRAFT_1648794 [Trametes sanguinea]
MVAQPTDALRRLEDDILYEIFQMLRPQGRLRPLSLTCRWIRFACSSVLFRECSVLSWTVDSSPEPRFIPRALWPYVWPELPWVIEDARLPRNPLRGRQSRNGRRDASVKVGETIREALHSMPLLCTVSIAISCGPSATGKPGVSPYVLEAILSAPQLLHFGMNGPLWHPADTIPPEVTFAPLTRLSTFNYRLNLHRSPLRVTRAEQEEITLVLDRTHGSLEYLVLPSECTPFNVMGAWQWPTLRTLRIRGERVTSSPSLIHILSKMPRLRHVYLMLAEPQSAELPPVWPPSLSLQCEWRELRSLAVAHPHPQDDLYSNLPNTLLDLALRCWPRYYKHHTNFKEILPDAGARWTDPLLPSSEMLSILKKVHAPHLTYLELEFRADSNDSQLFQHIGSAFPALVGMVIHRYRAEGEGTAPLVCLHGLLLSIHNVLVCSRSHPIQVNIATHLSTLEHLEVLMLHLDFADLPEVDIYKASSWKDPFMRPVYQKQLADNDVTFKHAANLFASVLGPALLYVCFLRPLTHARRRQWVPFRVVRSGGDGPVAEKCHIRDLPVDSFQLPHGHRFT